MTEPASSGSPQYEQDGTAVTMCPQGRTHQLWRVDITDESGSLIAHGEVRLQNVAGT